MLTREENDVLTRVGADTSMGKLMRAHWTPICLIEEVAEPDGKPVLIEALGERFVAFRDTDGRLGLLDELCPHRRASLVLGRNEECGLRCLYHGWKFDVEGNVLAMASEPEGSALMDKVKHRYYPTEEWGGFVWAWFGALGDMPKFEPPAFAPTEDTKIAILKINVPCNWAQITEGQIDSAHSSSLHATDMVPARVEGAAADSSSWYRPSTDKSPQLQIQRTSYGFRYAAVRRPIKNASTHNYVRVTQYIAPYTSLIPPNNMYNVASVIVPATDETSFFYFIAWGGNACPSTAEWRKFNATEPGIDLDEQWRPWRSIDNWFGQDRQAMKLDSFSGIKGIPNQDVAMWCSMPAIVDRSQDILGASDQAIVEFRQLMVDAATRGAGGDAAIGTGDDRHPHASIRAFEQVIPKETDWRDLLDAEKIAAE